MTTHYYDHELVQKTLKSISYAPRLHLFEHNHKSTNKNEICILGTIDIPFQQEKKLLIWVSVRDKDSSNRNQTSFMDT